MRDIQGVGPYCDVMQAPSPNDQGGIIRLGIRNETFRQYTRRQYYTPVAQYYGIVQDGLRLARHLFRGLNRPLMLKNDTEADKNVLIYAWRSELDFEWVGTPYDGNPEQKVPPPDRVFVVIVRQELPNEFKVDGSIERWNWVEEDGHLEHAPIAFQERYGERLWSRKI